MQNRPSRPPLPVIYEEAPPLGPDLIPDGGAAFCLRIRDVTYLHYHSTLELGWCVGGTGECYAEDRIFPFSAGDVQVIFPYQRHYSRSGPADISRWRFVCLDLSTLLPALGFFDPSSVEEWMQQEMGLFGIFSPARCPRVHAAALRFFEELYGEPDRPRRRELCGASLCALLAELSRASRDVEKLAIRRDPVLSQITPALREIPAGLAQGVQPSVGVLARLCAMSESNFRRVFRRATGCAPKEYILRAAIHRAEQRLLQTDDDIVSISADAGFSDVSGFGRQFRRQNGVPPTAFRDRYRR